MDVLSQKTLLALEAVVDVALHARPNPVQARDITARQGVPQRYLEQVMQTLVRANILRGVRGPQGGYRLARERRRISVLEIVQVIEGTTKESAPALSPLGQQVIAPLYARLREKLMQEIGTITIADLCADSGLDDKAAQNPQNKDTHDFTI